MAIRKQRNASAGDLGDLIDVELENVNDFDTIVWDEDLQKWVNYPNYQLAESNPTGLINGGELNIAGGTDIEIITGFGVIVDSYTNPSERPVIIGVQWDTLQTPITANPPVAGSIVYFTIANSGIPVVPSNSSFDVFYGEIKQYATRPTPEQIRDEIPVGVALHNGDSWKDISSPTVINNTASSFVEFTKQVIGTTFITDGGEVTQGNNHTLDQAQGIIWELNRNWHVNKADPNRETLPENIGFSFKYVNRDFTDVGALTNTIDPTMYDNNGNVQNIGGNNNRSTIQRVYLDAGDNYWILWGQAFYNNFSTALYNANIAVEVPQLLQSAVFLGSVVSERGKNDWDDNESIFIPAAGNGGSSGGGSPFIPTTFAGANTTGYVPDPLVEERRVLTDDASFDWRTKMLSYVLNDTYYPQETVYNEGYLSVAQVITTDYPTPQTVGQDLNVYTGVSPTAATLAKQLIFGNRYTLNTSVNINSLRVYVIAGNEYTVFYVSNPLTTPIVSEVASFTADNTGWRIINITPTLFLAGQTFDMVGIVSEPDPTPTVFTGNWDYDTPNNPATPPAGQISHDNKNTGRLRINYIDNDGSDRTAEIQALNIGDIIDGVGVRWSIQSNADSGTYASIGVAPSVQGTPDGVSEFSFETVTATPVTIMADPLYWTTSPYAGNVQGLLGADISYTDIVPDDNAYGVDINITQVEQSPDWKLFGIPTQVSSGGGGGGAGGGSVVNITNIQAKSLITQNPLGIGIAFAKQIAFGVAQLPQLDSNGTYKAINSGQKTVVLEIAMERTSNNSEAHLWVYSELNGVVQETEFFMLDNSRQREVYNVTSDVNFNVGDELKFFIYRANTGANDGGLYPAINPDGLPASASARLKVYTGVVS